jgi:hypothetical protein
VLRAEYPAAAGSIDAELARTTATVPAGDARERGIALGRSAAAAILAARRGDGWDVPGRYEFRRRIGAYRTTPPWSGFVVQPGFGAARPFGLTSPMQLRPAPPPELGSRAYADALNEVKRAGNADSRTRTADQTAYAVWWMEFAEGSVIRLARGLVAERQASLTQTARVFALLAMSLYDGYIAVWDSKFAYDGWRPYTAIRRAGEDGNPATEPDPAWEPLRPTPPFPEYVSAHAAGCAASFEVLKRMLGDAPFTMRTITAPDGMPTRTFDGFDAAAAECADSRVMLGWHFRFATDAGLALGRAVAGHIMAHHLAPAAGR